MGDLAVETELVGCDGNYQAQLSKAWEGVGTPNGGYLAAIAIRAAGEQANLSRPASFSCQYLNVASFEPVDVQVSKVRASRRAEALQVQMSQGAMPILSAFVWVVANELEGMRHDSIPRPAVPLPDEVRGGTALLEEEEGARIAPCWRNVDWRPIDYCRQSDLVPGQAIDRSWHRFIPHPTYEDPFIDAGRFLYLIDSIAHWPATRVQGIPFNKARFFAPNIDLTVQLHRQTSSAEWLLVEAVSPVADDGLVSSSLRVWSRNGQLLASGMSTLLCRRNPWYEAD